MSITEAQATKMGHLHQCEQEFIYDLIEEGATYDTAVALLHKQNKDNGKPVKVFHTHGPGRGILAGKEYFIYDWV